MKDCRQTVINLFLLSLCVIALGFSIARVVPCEITTETYIGILVTLLGVIVTVAIGYQIYSVFKFRDDLERQLKLLKRLENRVGNTRNQVDETMKNIDSLKEETNAANKNNKSLSQFVCYYTISHSEYINDKTNLSWILSSLRTIYFGLKCSDDINMDAVISGFCNRIDNLTLIDNKTNIQYYRKKTQEICQEINEFVQDKTEYVREKARIEEIMTKLNRKLDEKEKTTNNSNK